MATVVSIRVECGREGCERVFNAVPRHGFDDLHASSDTELVVEAFFDVAPEWRVAGGLFDLAFEARCPDHATKIVRGRFSDG